MEGYPNRTKLNTFNLAASKHNKFATLFVDGAADRIIEPHENFQFSHLKKRSFSG